MRLLFIVNVDWFFVSHRLPIALEALRRGHEVHLATTITDRLSELVAHGLVVHPLAIARGGVDPRVEWRSFQQMRAVLRAVRPDLVHLVTVKPVVFGGIAARLARARAVVAAVPGLGFVFVAAGWRAALRRWIVTRLYRHALAAPNTRVIFQNADDLGQLARAAALERRRCVVIRGSGVDLHTFSATVLPDDGVPLVVLPARLLADKGVREFVQAARILQRRGLRTRFALVGAPDPENRANIAPPELECWRAQGLVELWGERGDMPAVLAQAHVVALPSYREGLPKALLEAAACARAVVTTDVPGCRDAVEANVTGLLVPARDARALADAIERLVRDRALCETMGRAGRRLAEREFSIERVVAAHFALYHELLGARCGESS